MIYTLGKKRLETAGEDFYIAPGAQVIGAVRMGHEASIWFNCVLRADNDWIILGDGTNVQDGTIIHANAGVSVVLANNVSVGHRALLHGCTVGEETLIGNAAVVLDEVSIGSHCLIAAGALVSPGKAIPDRSVVVGVPGKIVREVSDRDLVMIKDTAAHYRARGQWYKCALAVDERSRR